MKRVFAFILAITMVIAISLFAGCGDTTPTEPSGTESSSTSSDVVPSDGKTGGTEGPEVTTGGGNDGTSGGDVVTPIDDTTSSGGDIIVEPLDGTQKLPGYEDVDFRGKIINIVAQGNHSSGWNCDQEIYSEESTSIAVAARKRNEIMEKFYNCTINLISSDAPGTLATAAVTGGQNDVDLYSIMYYAGNYANVYNLQAFDIDFTNPWWDHQWVKTATVKDSVGTPKMFSVIGDFALTSGRATFALMYDRTVYDTVGITDDVYQLVRDKKWTMDKFVEMITKAARDTSGNSEIKYAEGDLMGCLTSNFGAHALHAASGFSIISVNDGIMSFDVSSNVTAWSDVIDKAIEIAKTPGFQDVGYGNVHEGMKNSSSLFYLKDLGSLEVIADVDVSLGLLPMPLYSETQENYAHHVDDHVMHYAVPICVTDVEGMADFLELFAYHSRFTTRQAWIDTYSIEYCGDSDSAEMLDLILSTRTYDPGYLYIQVEGDLSNMIQTGKNGISKWADRTEQKVADGITNFVNVRTGLQG